MKRLLDWTGDKIYHKFVRPREDRAHRALAISTNRPRGPEWEQTGPTSWNNVKFVDQLDRTRLYRRVGQSMPIYGRRRSSFRRSIFRRRRSAYASRFRRRRMSRFRSSRNTFHIRRVSRRVSKISRMIETKFFNGQLIGGATLPSNIGADTRLLFASVGFVDISRNAQGVALNQFIGWRMDPVAFDWYSVFSLASNTGIPITVDFRLLIYEVKSGNGTYPPSDEKYHQLFQPQDGNVADLTPLNKLFDFSSAFEAEEKMLMVSPLIRGFTKMARVLYHKRWKLDIPNRVSGTMRFRTRRPLPIKFTDTSGGTIAQGQRIYPPNAIYWVLLYRFSRPRQAANEIVEVGFRMYNILKYKDP